MVVLMAWVAGQMRPLLALDELVGDVSVLVVVYLSVKTVSFGRHHTLLLTGCGSGSSPRSNAASIPDRVR
jgi:hypothetical protein